MDKLYVKFNRPRTAREFIKIFFNGGRAKATYKNPGGNITHCESGRRRSIDDMIILLKTYYPSLSTSKIFEYLISTEIKGSGIFISNFYKLELRYCPTIKRPVFYCKNVKIPRIKYFNNIRGENSKYTWRMLIDNLGRSKFEELYK